MNIFVLASDPYLAARYHCDKHVVKMIVESGQMLSTALRYHGYDSSTLYKTSHLNHPCSVWARQSRPNFEWLCDLMDGLLNQYYFRYGYQKSKVHACEPLLAEAWKQRRKVPNASRSPHPKCMPRHCIVPNVITSYRNYYILEKNGFAVWKFSKTPSWYIEGITKE